MRRVGRWRATAETGLVPRNDHEVLAVRGEATREGGTDAGRRAGAEGSGHPLTLTRPFVLITVGGQDIR